MMRNVGQVTKAMGKAPMGRASLRKRRYMMLGVLLAVLSWGIGFATSCSSAAQSVSWTPVGPAPTVNGFTDDTENASGRIVALAAHPTDATTLYIAAAGGRVWKTTDGGTSWTPLTDTQRTLFMGALALAPTALEVKSGGDQDFMK